MPDGVTRVTITREMAIRAMKHMDEYTMPHEDAKREDMLTYMYLMWKDTERLRLETAALARHKEAADNLSARHAAYSFASSQPLVS